MRLRLLFVAGSVLVLSAVANGGVGTGRAAGFQGVPGMTYANGMGHGSEMMGRSGPGGFGMGVTGSGPANASGIGSGSGMMGRSGPGDVMGGHFGQLPAGSPSISIDQAQKNVQQYLASYGNSDLKIDELIQFQDNFYAGVTEKGTGVVAFALLVNPVTGAVGPEPGPNMMWNTKYGMSPGSMVGGRGQSAAMTVNPEQAQKIAQQWLNANQAGTTAKTPDRFYGFYTVDIDKDGQLAGMLSVNGSTGAVWYHSWHGGFIQGKQLVP